MGGIIRLEAFFAVEKLVCVCGELVCVVSKLVGKPLDKSTSKPASKPASKVLSKVMGELLSELLNIWGCNLVYLIPGK